MRLNNCQGCISTLKRLVITRLIYYEKQLHERCSKAVKETANEDAVKGKLAKEAPVLRAA